MIPTGTPHRIHVDSTWILRRYVEDQISTNFHVVSTYFFPCNFTGQKIHVVSTYFFRCNFAGRKIHVVSTYFFRCNFDGRKIHVVSTYFFRCNFDGRNMHIVFTYFFDVILLGKDLTLFLVSCKLMKTFKKFFPVFVTLNS